jgi:ABC-type multidrug transport system fused ATPase/permease subunit
LRAECRLTAVLLVAHRYSTVSHADRIVMLDRGRVVGQGTPAELRASSTGYREFVDRQSVRAGGAADHSRGKEMANVVP